MARCRSGDRHSRVNRLVLGAWWQVAPAWRTSLVIDPRFELDIDESVRGSRRTVTTNAATGLVVSDTTQSLDDDNDVTFTYPTSVTLGVAWRPDDRQTLALDLIYTRWSEYAIERDGDEVSPLSPFLDPDDFDDDVTLRVGYEYVVILPRWVLIPRAGLLYERLPGVEPLPSLSSDASETEAGADEWYGATLGLGAFKRGISYDAVLQARHVRDVGTGIYAPPDDAADVTTITLRFGTNIAF